MVKNAMFSRHKYQLSLQLGMIWLEKAFIPWVLLMSSGRALIPLSNPVIGQNSFSRYQEDFHELQVQLFL